MSMDFLKFAPESEDNGNDSKQADPWHVLVVDDDKGLHDVTKLALARLEVLDRPLEIHSAFSAIEAKKMLLEKTSFCLSLIDVVMETDYSGLELVDWIRNSLGNNDIRIVLRTGQAGVAPEPQIVRNHNINDYRNKSDLTSQSLNSCVLNNIRSYKYISEISQDLRLFKSVADASRNMYEIESSERLASAALDELITILGAQNASLVMVRRIISEDGESHDTVTSCTSKLSGSYNDVSDELPTSIADKLNLVFDSQSIEINDNSIEASISSPNKTRTAYALYAKFSGTAVDPNYQALELYTRHVLLMQERMLLA